ncbi:hypothetical protein E2320_008702, partial [Naja naja]
MLLSYWLSNLGSPMCAKYPSCIQEKIINWQCTFAVIQTESFQCLMSAAELLTIFKQNPVLLQITYFNLSKIAYLWFLINVIDVGGSEVQSEVAMCSLLCLLLMKPFVYILWN